MEQIEVRSASGKLVGMLVGGTALEIKRGPRLFAVDLLALLHGGVPVVLERVLHPEGVEPTQEAEREDIAE